MKNLPSLTIIIIITGTAEARVDELCNCLIPLENTISHLLVTPMIVVLIHSHFNFLTGLLLDIILFAS